MCRLKKRYIFPLLLLFVLIFAWLVLTNWVLPRRLFRKVVLNPIPTSVKSIRGSGFFSSDGYRTSVLRFNISESDMQLILKSDQFNEIEYVEYNNNILRFAESKKAPRGGISLLLFGDLRKWFTPSWFELDKWKTFKAYLVEKRDIDFHKVRLLIYNQDISQAYFIDHEMRGP